MYDSIILHTDCLEQVSLLDMEQRGALFTAILLYASGEELLPLDPVVAMAFSFIRAKIDREKKKYSDTIEKRKAGGSRGGRPKNEHGKEDTPAEEETAADCQGEGDKPHPDGAIEVQCAASKDEPQTEKPQGFLEQDKNLKVFKKPQGFFEAEKNPVPVPDPDPVPVPDPVCKEKGSPTGSPKRKPANRREKDKPKPDYKKIASWFNQNCQEFPAVKEITKKREALIDAFLSDHEESELYSLFSMASASDFLTGKSGSGWKASFDWIMKPENRVKILEGTYENRRQEAVRTWERPETARSGTTQARGAPTRKNGFVNFDQRPIDFDALMRKKQEDLTKIRGGKDREQSDLTGAADP